MFGRASQRTRLTDSKNVRSCIFPLARQIAALTPRSPLPNPPWRTGEGEGGGEAQTNSVDHLPGSTASSARLPLLLCVLAAHGAGIAMLAQTKSAATSVVPAPAIEVSLITLPVPLPVAVPVAAPPTSAPPPKPEVIRRDPPAPRQKPAKNPIPRPEAISEPAPAVQSAASEESTSAPVVAAAAPPAPAAATPVTPARFDAAYLQNPPPPYPPLAKRMGEQGRVTLRVFVSPEGRADGIELKASSGSARLDEAALQTVRQWRFIPARQGNKPVGAWVIVPISFNLEG